LYFKICLRRFFTPCLPAGRHHVASHRFSEVSLICRLADKPNYKGAIFHILMVLFSFYIRYFIFMDIIAKGVLLNLLLWYNISKIR